MVFAEDTFLADVDENTIKFLARIFGGQQPIFDKKSIETHSYGYVNNMCWSGELPSYVTMYYKDDIFSYAPAQMTDGEFAALKYFLDNPEASGVLVFDFNYFKHCYKNLEGKNNYVITLAAHEIMKEIEFDCMFDDRYED